MGQYHCQDPAGRQGLRVKWFHGKDPLHIPSLGSEGAGNVVTTKG